MEKDIERETHISRVQNFNKKAKDFLLGCSLFGKEIDLENNEEIIAGLYAVIMTQSRKTRDTYAASASSWKTQEI